MLVEYMKYFPYPSIRDAQKEAIEHALDALITNDKRFVIIEAGTGVGKSAVGLTLVKYMQEYAPASSEGFGSGGYFLTTQKILQDQYIKDFGTRGMTSLKSSSNYKCKFHKGNTCAESARMLRTAEKGSEFWNTCVFKCPYKRAKRMFLESKEGVTNFPYFLAETTYSGKITPRNVLVVDEAHNTDTELSKFVEIIVTDRFAKQLLKLQMPSLHTQLQAYTWIKDVYAPKLKSHFKHMESILDRYVGLREKIKEFATIAKQYELLDKHLCKINRFLEIYEKDNWVFNEASSDGKSSRKLEFKPIDVAPYAEDMIFRLGRKVIMMSASILDKDAFCETLGIDPSDASFISIPSPFPIENRPILTFPIGKMSFKEIDQTLPKLATAVKEILENHPDEKGIIHCHTFKIANYLKKNIRNSRLLIHNSDNREETLRKHLRAAKPTVLLSPSMTEGVDLVEDASRFQIICKVPYPYLGDKLVKKRMNKWKWWYPLKTAKTIVQATGRSVRSKDDHAVTYILDSDWDRFYQRNSGLFPKGFRDCVR